MDTKELNTYLSISQNNYDLQPFQEYTPEEIAKATYIYINPDDANWQLGFKKMNAIPREAWIHLEDIHPDLEIPIFIY